MSQMPQQAAPATCPSCAEPVEPDDLFCGACGHDLSVVPAPPRDHPTLPMTGPATPTPPAPGTPATPGPAAPASVMPHSPTPGAPGPGPSAPGAQNSGTPNSGPADPGSPGPGSPAAGDDVEWPAPEPHRSDSASPTTHLPTDLPGTDSGGHPLHPGAPEAPAGQPASGVRFDRPAEPEEYPLQAPDPRAADETLAPEPQPAPPATTCVACRAGRVDSDGYCENCGHAQPRERDHMERESGPAAAVSDRGLRHHRNEDFFALGHTTLPDGSPATHAVVCDGVSSATRPDEASAAAARAAGDTLLAALPRGTHPQAAMHEAIVAAAQAVNALAGDPDTAREHDPHHNAPACTIVSAVVAAGLLVVGWVGDSRAYWVPDDRSAPPARLTEDDSWAAQMVAAGLMSEAQAYADERAHAITGWLGADAYELDPHTASFTPDRPGVVVVCTDGLWNYAETAQEMAETIPADAAVRPLHSARVLVGHALDGGGHDNVTVAVLPFPAPPRGAGSA